MHLWVRQSSGIERPWKRLGSEGKQENKAPCWEEDKKQRKAQPRSQPAPSSAGSHGFLRNAGILNLSSSALGKSQGALNKPEVEILQLQTKALVKLGAKHKRNLKISSNTEVSSFRGSLAELHRVGTELLEFFPLSLTVNGTSSVPGSAWPQQAAHVGLSPKGDSRAGRGPERDRAPFPGNPGQDP